ncbi:MAG: HDIG domain-containing protein [Gemmatimonadetes bacterium]|nr:HDIG domain-containing protein [Gemmatimonadota bacterium]
MGERIGLREAWRTLSNPAARGWRAGVVQHGPRLLVLVALSVALHLLFPVAPLPDIPVLEKGMVSDQDVIAQVPFPIYKTDQELQRERAEAAASVIPIFDYVPGAVDTMEARVRAFMARIDSVVARDGGVAAEQAGVRAVAAANGLPVTPEVIELLRGARSRGILARSLVLTIRTDLPTGVASATELKESASTQVRIRRGGTERTVPRDSVLTAPYLYERSSRYLPWNAPQGAAELQRLLLIRFFEPSIQLNAAATELAREQARAAVPTVKGHVLRGERIIGAHEQVRDAELQRLRAYQDELTRRGHLQSGAEKWKRAGGAILRNFLLLLGFGLLLRFYRPRVYGAFRQVLVLGVIVFAVAVGAALVDRFDAPPELIPTALLALVVAALWDGRMALHLALIVSILLAVQTPFLGMSALLTMVAGGAGAALSVRVVERRSQTWVFIALIAGTYVAMAVALGLLRSSPIHDVYRSARWGVLSATGSALVAMGVLPLLEAFTHITTNQTLLELANMNRPLLRRLALEAPGTYAHSINVANLAEAAARAIGADSLLTRVGTYYHDVGKIAKPQYFIENQPQGRNPHDRLKPSMSAAIVRGHVLEGVRLADQYKLPESVKAFIREHHGTQSIGFFLEQARQLNPSAEINPAEFTYPGPRPQSRETALLMLADSVESAARVLQDPTPERITALVNRIVETKIAAGQLDECPLTFGDLSRVKEQFVKVLTGMYHHRIDYPAPARESAAALPLGPVAAKPSGAG